MQAYIDTAVVVAALGTGSSALFAGSGHHRANTQSSVHGLYKWTGLAEAYSVLARTPFRPSVLPMEAWQFLSDNVFPLPDCDASSRVLQRDDRLLGPPRLAWRPHIRRHTSVLCTPGFLRSHLYLQPAPDLFRSYRFSAQFSLNSTFAPARMKSCIIVLCD